MAYITIEAEDHGGLRTLHEQVSREDLDNAVFSRHLVERLQWAVADTDPIREMEGPRQTFREGDHVTVPHPDRPSDSVAAIFMAPVDPRDVRDSGDDSAWIRYSNGLLEGSSDHLRYSDIRPADTYLSDAHD